MNIVIKRLLYNLLRGLKERTDIDIKTDISKACGNYFCATIVAVLTDLGDHDSWSAAFKPCKGVGKLLSFLKECVILHLRHIDTGVEPGDCAVPSEGFLAGQ